MQKIPFVQIQAILTEYYKNPEISKNQRVGQYFLNALSKETNPKLFYEENGSKAIQEIYDTYLEESK